MNDEKLNQLIERMNQLEAQVSQLNTPVTIYSRSDSDDNEMSDKLKSRQLLLQTIQSMYPGLMVTIAKRQDGGGLLLINKQNNKTYKMKCYYSKNHRQERLFGWFSLRISDLIENSYDFYAMSLDFNQKHHVFIFSHNQVMEVLKERNPLKDLRKSNEPIEHLYIEAIHHQFFETREIDKSLDQYRGVVEGGVNVSYSYEQYTLIHEVIGNINTEPNKPFITTDLSVIKSKIHEVLKSQFTIPLYRKDFYYTGNLQQFIEINSEHIQLNAIDFDSKNIKSIVIHIQAGKNTSLSTIHHLFTEIEAFFNVNALRGLSIHQGSGTLSQIFIIGHKEV